MFNVRLSGDNLGGEIAVTWLSRLMSLIMSFCADLFFPRDALDEIWD